MLRLLALGLFVSLTTASIVVGAPESVGTLLDTGRLLLFTGRCCLPMLRCIPLVRNEAHIHSLRTTQKHTRARDIRTFAFCEEGSFEVNAAQPQKRPVGVVESLTGLEEEKIGPERHKAAAVSYAAPAPLVVVYGRLKRRPATGREEKPEPKRASSRVGMPPSR